MKTFRPCAMVMLWISIIMASTTFSGVPIKAKEGSLKVLACALVAFFVVGHGNEGAVYEQSLEDHDMFFAMPSQDEIGFFAPTFSDERMGDIELSRVEVLCDDCMREEFVSDFIAEEYEVPAPRFITQSYEGNIEVNTVEEASQVAPPLLRESDVERRRLQRREGDSEEFEAERRKAVKEFNFWIKILASGAAFVLSLSAYFIYLSVWEDCNVCLKKYTWYKRSKYAQCVRACCMEEERCCCFTNRLSSRQIIGQKNGNLYYQNGRDASMMV